MSTSKAYSFTLLKTVDGEFFGDGGFQVGNYQTTGSGTIEALIIEDQFENIRIGLDAGAALNANTRRNILFGEGAGQNLAFGDDNIVHGYQAGQAMTSASDNVFMGNRAGALCTTGSRNTAMGTNAAEGLTTGVDNVCLGHNVGLVLGAASNNVLMGKDTGLALTGAASTDNVFFGHRCGINATSAARCTLIGEDVGKGMAGATDNTIIGNLTGNDITTGSFNVFLGHGAALLVDTSTAVVAVGSAAAQSYSGSGAVAIGAQALEDAVGGGTNDDMVAIGNQALWRGSTEDSLVAIGDGAGRSIGGGVSLTVAIGHNAMGGSGSAFASATNNTAVGAFALQTGSGLTLAPSSATHIGYNAGGNKTFGDFCTGVGYMADYDSSGIASTAIGFQAMDNGSGNYCVAVGHQAGRGWSTNFERDMIAIGASSGGGTGSLNPSCSLGSGAASTVAAPLALGSAAHPLATVAGTNKPSVQDSTGYIRLTFGGGNIAYLPVYDTP